MKIYLNSRTMKTPQWQPAWQQVLFKVDLTPSRTSLLMLKAIARHKLTTVTKKKPPSTLSTLRSISCKLQFGCNIVFNAFLSCICIKLVYRDHRRHSRSVRDGWGSQIGSAGAVKGLTWSYTAWQTNCEVWRRSKGISKQIIIAFF